jgi:hypothetical protein
MKDFDKFVEEAIKIAGKAGERKRKFKTRTASSLAASRMAELERAETGATKRLGITEAGLGKRLKKEQEFARPKQSAEISKLGALERLRGAEAERVSYGTEFERGKRGTVESILEARGRQTEAGAREAELGISEMERDIRLRDEAGVVAQTRAAAPPAAVPRVPAKSGRTVNPVLKKAWHLSPPGAALYGYKNIADWLGYGAKKGAEWAFPRTK